MMPQEEEEVRNIGTGCESGSISSAGADDDTSGNIINRLLMGEIIPGLWIGGIFAVKELDNLTDRQWTIISALSSDRLVNLVERNLTVYREEKPDLIRNHVMWNIPDKPKAEFVSQKLVEVLDEMEEAIKPESNRACLVHCAFGISRSSSICAAYLISRHGRTLAQALDTIRQARSSASPNIGFISGLRAIEQCNGNIEAARQRLGLAAEAAAAAARKRYDDRKQLRHESVNSLALCIQVAQCDNAINR